MKTELEAQDIEQIAEMVVERLKLVLKGSKDKHDTEDELFDVQGLAEYLKVSEKWIYERTHLKKIPFRKITGHLLFRKREIDRWIDQHKVAA